jgi:hypothetical protein
VVPFESLCVLHGFLGGYLRARSFLTTLLGLQLQPRINNSYDSMFTNMVAPLPISMFLRSLHFGSLERSGPLPLPITSSSYPLYIVCPYGITIQDRVNNYNLSTLRRMRRREGLAEDGSKSSSMPMSRESVR